MKSININRKIANQQHAYLLGCSVDASHAIILFNRLRKKEFTTGTTKQDNWLESALLSQIIVLMHKFFDTSRNAIGIDKFIKDNAQHLTNLKNIKDITEKLEIIKKDNSLLIEQIKNNRHESVHIPQKRKLGVTESVAIKIRELGKITGNEEYKNQKSVLDENMGFSVGNFPTEQAKTLMDKLSKLILAILYPLTLKRMPKQDANN